MNQGRTFPLLAPAILVNLLLVGGASVLLVTQSLGMGPGGTPDAPSLDGFRQALARPEVQGAIGRTLIVALATTAVSVLAALPLAFAVLAVPRGRRLAESLLYLPIAIPHLVAVAGIAGLLSQSGTLARLAYMVGMIDEPAGFPALLYDRSGMGVLLVYAWKQIPFVAVALIAILRSAAGGLAEQARTLGAGARQRFFRIHLPLIAPVLAPTSAIITAFVIGSFEVPLLVDQRFPTMLSVVAYRLYIDIDLGLRPQAMAVGVLVSLLTLSVIAVGALAVRSLRAIASWVRRLDRAR